MRAGGTQVAIGLVAVSLAGCSLFSLDSLQEFDGAGGASSASSVTTATAASATTQAAEASSASSSTSGPSSTSSVDVASSASSSQSGAGGGAGTGGGGGEPASTPYADAVMTDGPIAYLHLDDGGGSGIAVDSVGANDGTIVGGVTLEEPSAVADTGGRAMRFDGTSGLLLLGDVLDFPDGSPFSIELWAKHAATRLDHLEWIFSKEVGIDEEREGYCLLTAPDLSVGAEVWFGDLDAAVAYDDGPTELDVWHHIVVTGDTSSLLIFVDGVQHNQGGYTGGLADTTGDLLFAAQAGQQNQFDGWLDEIAVYDHILTPERIAAHREAAE